MAKMLQQQPQQGGGLGDALLEMLLPMLLKNRREVVPSTAKTWGSFMGGTSPDLNILGGMGGNFDPTPAFGGLGPGGQWPGLAPNLGARLPETNRMIVEALFGMR